MARGAIAIDDAFFDSVSEYVKPLAGRAAYSASDYDSNQLAREWTASRTQLAYRSYIVWKHQPFTGNLLNVNEKGNRVTLNNSPRDEALSVWMFGGSTLWSSGVPDGLTIPNQLGKLLNQEWGVDTQVHNYSEVGFVSTQELIFLLRELQLGGRPDVAVFYDGANDATTANVFPELPAVHHDFGCIREKLGEKTRKLRQDP